MKSVLCLIALIILSSCGGTLSPTSAVDETDSDANSSTPGAGELSARFIFNKDNFTDLSDFVATQQTRNQCLGDVLKTYYPAGQDYSGTPSSFPASAIIDSLSPTTRPAFVKNVSVDITNTYFPLVQPSVVQSDACSYRGGAGAAEPAPCADFDEIISVTPSPTVAPTPVSLPTPVPTVTPSTTQYYGSQFYRVRDDWCTSQGPVLNEGVEASKTFVGGVNIDLDRTQLGIAEDLLMMVTYQALNANSAWPGVQTVSDETILEVNLVGTTLGLDLLMGARQPRPWADFQSSQVPVYHKRVATLRDPSSSLRTEQIYIPLSENRLIDRIRLERVRGSYHLYQIDLYRLGNRVN